MLNSGHALESQSSNSAARTSRPTHTQTAVQIRVLAPLDPPLLPRSSHSGRILFRRLICPIYWKHEAGRWTWNPPIPNNKEHFATVLAMNSHLQSLTVRLVYCQHWSSESEVDRIIRRLLSPCQTVGTEDHLTSDLTSGQVVLRHS